MLKLLVPLLLALAGLGGGIGAGLALRPAPEIAAPEDAPPVCTPAETAVLAVPDHGGDGHGTEDGAHDYVKMNNQFVVPVIEDGRVGSLVVLAITLEVAPGQTEAVYDREPKLRDAFLQVLFDHANAGGFQGNFTASTRMDTLRMALREVALKTLGGILSDVLIIDIVRQDA